MRFFRFSVTHSKSLSYFYLLCFPDNELVKSGSLGFSLTNFTEFRVTITKSKSSMVTPSVFSYITSDSNTKDIWFTTSR